MVRSRIAEYGQCGGVSLAEVDVPPPGPCQVQVRVTACGVCSWDVWTYRHGHDAERPTPPGHEAVGRIHALGDGASGLNIGQLVAVRGGGFCDFCNVPAQKAYPLPEGVVKDAHWAVEPVSCVITALDHAPPPPGDRVCVIGCGFMGLLLVQALGRCLLGDLIAIDNNADRLTLAGEMGATRMIDGRLEGGTDILQAVGPPADLCFDCTSGRNGLATATRLVRQGGTVVVFGWKREPLGDLGTDWHMKGLTVHNPTPFCRKRDVFPPAIRLIERGHVSPGRLVTHTEPMVRLDRLLEQASTRAGGYVKGVVLTEQ